MSAHPFGPEDDDPSPANDPWRLTNEQLNAAERDFVGLGGPGVADLMRPRIRPEHKPIVERIARLPWHDEPPERAAREAFSILIEMTVPGGPIDPSDDESDTPWCSMLVRLLGQPVIGSKRARQWFALLMRHRWNDVPVSAVAESTAAYAVALLEHLRGRESEARYWMRVGAVQTEDDGRPGMSVAMVIRAARLMRVP